jgi:NAD(P) transhydrogenase subunit alpha
MIAMIDFVSLALSACAEVSTSVSAEDLLPLGAMPVASAAAAASPFVFQVSIFALACFVGYYVVWSVTPALHTPLMAVTNAISSVIVVGALVAAAAHGLTQEGWIAKILGAVAVMLASVNIFGGFLVTQRMLAMYKKKGQ